jgi:hypothetical protein
MLRGFRFRLDGGQLSFGVRRLLCPMGVLMANLNQVGATKVACNNGNDVRFAILSRVAAVALLTPLVGYLVDESDRRVWEVIQDYSHSELLVFLAGCGIVACVEVLAWLLRLPFTKGTSTA